MRRFPIWTLIAIFLAAAFSVSCEGPGVPAARERRGNENILHYDVNAPFTSLNPIEVCYSGSTMIFPLLYDYLFVPNPQGELEPDLARKWSYDAKNLTWTIYLREDARFHDKKPVTSADVKYSLNELLKQKHPAIQGLLDHISLLSDTALSIALKRDEPDFFHRTWGMEIFPRPDGGKTDYHNHPVGSGPFRFEYRRGESEVGLVANEDYFQGRPSLDGVVFHYQPAKEKAWTRLLSGRADIAQEVSPKNYEMLGQYEERYYFDLYTLNWYAILLYNTSDPLFSNPRVRRALTHAINREYIVEELLGGYGKTALSCMGVSPPFRNQKVEQIPYNPQEALRLLGEAGWSYNKDSRCLRKGSKPFEFTVLVFDEHQVEKRVAQYLRLCLNDVGVKVHLRLLPFEQIYGRYWGNDAFEAVLTEFRCKHDDPENLREQWSGDASTRSEAGCFEHPEVTALIYKALEESDPPVRKDLFYEADALITSLQPGTFLFHKTAIDVMSKRFRLLMPFSLTNEGIYHLRYASVNPNWHPSAP
ncbi:MAG: ABC transporter substrate-binding protein [Thermodesulfobacteriota bacterium]|nr:ABC transporter substrate-binding protein [Thermodesulfobacteriota bacterium]